MISSHMHAPEGAISGALAGGTLLLAGADPVGLVLGVAAAVLTTFIHGGIDSRSRAFCSVILAALLAGYGAPVAAQVLLTQFPAQAAAIAIAGPLLSILIGALSPTAIVAAIEAIKRKGGEA